MGNKESVFYPDSSDDFGGLNRKMVVVYVNEATKEYHYFQSDPPKYMKFSYTIYELLKLKLCKNCIKICTSMVTTNTYVTGEEIVHLNSQCSNIPFPKLSTQSTLWDTKDLIKCNKCFDYQSNPTCN
jgi:hypothetical protein